MYAGLKVAVVMPAHNEAKFIKRAINSVPMFVDRIFLVDDGSDDGTGEIASDLASTKLQILEHSTNLGVGAAIATGYKAAIDYGADVACVMAGDAQMDPRDMPALLDALAEGAGYAKGNRFLWPGPERQPLSRYLGGMAISYVNRVVTGCKEIFDSQCGYTAISRSALKLLELDQLWPRFGYPNDLIARLHEAGVAIVDVPVRPVYDGQGSHMTPWVALRDISAVLARCGIRRITNRQVQVRCDFSS
ncbi:MAG: glycosyltransferase family 2 protein [Deltaproteobacteria bacterium]|nr:glycosyltransferase family 2 protein [Deltaproteobacteria bacterium]